MDGIVNAAGFNRKIISKRASYDSISPIRKAAGCSFGSGKRARHALTREPGESEV
jgi:hypothetical protein